MSEMWGTLKMTKRALPLSHAEWEALQKKLHIEITSITSEVIFGDILRRGRRVGQVQFFANSKLRGAIKKFRQVGIPVIFPDLVRNTKPPKTGRHA